MTSISGSRRKAIANLGLFSISLVPLVLYLFIISQRIHLPFDLEWGEGSGINQIYQILSGDRLYAAPTLTFAPLVYTPFYYWLSAQVARIGVPVALAGRLVSVLASFGSAGITAWLVIKETGNRMAGWLASMLFLACFAISDGFYDLVRVDSLYVFVLLVAFLVLRTHSNPLVMISTGLMILLGIYIKQSSLIVFAPILIYLLVKDWKMAWPLILTVLLGLIVPFYWINDFSGGWFGYYVLRLPQEHGFSLISAVDFWIGDLLGPLGIAAGFSLVYLIKGWFAQSDDERLGEPDTDISAREVERKQGVMFFALFALGAIGAGWITRSSNGGGANNAMSAYAAIAILFGLGFNQAGVLISSREKSRDVNLVLLFSLTAMQLIGLIYNPFNFIPTTGEVKANQALLEYFSEADGLIWAPYRSHLPRLINEPPSIHAVNLFEMTGYFKGEILPEGLELVRQIRENVCNQVYGVIMLDQPIPWIEEQIVQAYEPDDSYPEIEDMRRSHLLEWQGGFGSLFIPRQDFDPSSCLNQISEE